MTANGILQIVVYFVVLLALTKPLGLFMANVYEGKRTFLSPVLGPVERLFYRAAGVKADDEMTFASYAGAMLAINFAGFLVVYAIQRFQGYLPLNPQALSGTSPDLAFNTAISFATNTNWQSYGGESTMSYATQMLGLTVQNFVSCATGMACVVALIRGVSRKVTPNIGSFWVDLTRSTLYVLLPLSVVLALLLVSQGVVQTFGGSVTAKLVAPLAGSDGKPIVEQVLALGPAASQVAIKQLGTNGGGFFNVNSAHPFENPNALSNFAQVLSILLIPAALCYTFGKMVGDTRQGWALLTTMTVILVPLVLACTYFEQQGNPGFAAHGVDQIASAFQAGGNMEGKETRFGIANSTLWAGATTAASNGSVNAMHDSFTPLGGLVPLFLIQTGEVVFGGAGSGLYGMLIYAVITVFIAGLMVGRTPEYLGKKIEAFEMKMASLVILIPASAVLLGTAVALVVQPGKAGIFNPGAHGFSEALYAFSSAANNNGSAFGGVSANTPFWNTSLGIAMFFGRYPLAIAALAIGASLAKKKLVPAGTGTLPTHGPLFVAMLVGVVLIVGALTFVPALALGPIVEHLLLNS